MIRTATIVTVLIFTSLFAKAEVDNVYVVFYATLKGKTGHIGIAVDQYKIVYRDVLEGDRIVEKSDTVFTGEMVYFDLWPNDDHFNVRRTGTDIPAVYYKLPVTSNEEITLNSLYDKGIPHKEHYPCDGLLKITTSWSQDQWLIGMLDSMVEANRKFNAQDFNCSDFVRIPLERLLNRRLRCREFILVGWSSTPNKLYRRLRKIDEVEVIKNGDDKAMGSFLGQRVLYRFLHPPKKRK